MFFRINVVSMYSFPAFLYTLFRSFLDIIDNYINIYIGVP